MNEGIEIQSLKVRNLHITVDTVALDTVVMNTNWLTEEGSCKNEELIILVGTVWNIFPHG